MEVELLSVITAEASSMMPLSFPTGQSLDFDVSTVPLPTYGLSDPHSPDRALRDGELFEIVIQKMVDRWSGSIEAGEGPSVRAGG